MNKKRFLALFSCIWGLSVVSAIGISFIPTAQTNSDSNHINVNTNQRISLQDQKKLVNHADTQQGSTLGALRRWQNNNFTGIQLADKGFAVLTGDTDSGYTVTRTDSFGGVLWTFNPQTYQADSNLKAGNDNTTTYTDSGIQNKAVVEIQQDAQNPTTYYVLLIPKTALDNFSSYQSSASYTQLLSNPSLQASVVQITENLSDTANPVTVTSFANISPKTMVDNYPNTWKVVNGPSSFSSTDHPTWFSGSSNSETMSMYGDAYLANIGNMYVVNNYVLIFGGNGSQSTNPDALSMGIFRINFNDPKAIEVTGIPYAYVLAGLSTNFFNGRYLSRLPVGQDSTFSYVPRMAVGGVSAFPGQDASQSTSLFIAGSLTVGQDSNSWTWAKLKNGRPTIVGLSVDGASSIALTPQASSSIISSQNLKGYGSYGDNHYANSGAGSGNSANYATRWNSVTSVTKTNFLPLNNLNSNPTEKNSVDPLTLAGFKLNISQILNLQTNTISDVQSTTPNNSYLNIIDSNYADFGVNIGFVMGYYIGSNTRTEGNGQTGSSSNNGQSWVTGGSGQFGRPQQAWDGGLGMFTSLFGYSPKSVANLLPYNTKEPGASPTSTTGNLGYVMQVGAFIYFFNLTGFDGYAQLPDANPVLSPITSGNALSSPPTNPDLPTAGTNTLPTINVDNANRYSQYFTYNLMPSSVYSYDARIGNNPSYIDGKTNLLANAVIPTSFKPWSDFAGLSVSNAASQGGVTSSWIIGNTSSVYVNNGFSGPSITDDNGNIIFATISSLSGKITAENGYAVNGSFSITQGNNPPMNTSSTSINLANLTTLSGVIKAPNAGSFYFQEGGLGVSYYKYNPPTAISLMAAPFQDAAADQKRYLGTGSFITNPGDVIRTKSVIALYEMSNGEMVLKSDLFTALFTYQQPTVFVNGQNKINTRILVTNVNVVTQSATFTAQVQNPFTNQYVTIPSSTGPNNQNANVVYQDFFNKQPSYLLAVAIAVPLVVVALVVGLGVGIGIPISKNKKALKQGFDISNKKVDTLTTAVGSVFKQIINRTQIGNIKKTPQMLKAKSKPTTDPSKPKPVAPKKVTAPGSKIVPTPPPMPRSNVAAPTPSFNSPKKA